MQISIPVKSAQSEEALKEIESLIVEKLKHIDAKKFIHQAASSATQLSLIPDEKPGQLASDDKQARIQALPRLGIDRSIFSVRQELLLAIVIFFVSRTLQSFSVPGIVVDLNVPFGTHEIVVAVPWMIIFIIGLLGRAYCLLNDAQHILGRRHLRSQYGNFSFERKEVEIPYESILFVEVNQNVLDRFFRVGTILAGRNTQANAEIVMRGVKYPHKWVKMIKQRMALAKGLNDEEEFLD